MCCGLVATTTHFFSLLEYLVLYEHQSVSKCNILNKISINLLHKVTHSSSDFII